MDNLTNILFFLGAIQGFLLSLFLFSIKVNRISNRFLAILTFSWGLILLLFPLQDYDIYRHFPHLLNTIENLLFYIFPLLYLHSKYLLSNYSKVKRSDFLHFLPGLTMMLLHSEFYFLSGEEKIEAVINKNNYYATLEIIGDEVIGLQGIIYSILIFRLLSKYKRKVAHLHSSINKVMIRAQYTGTTLILIAWIIGITAINLAHFDIYFTVDLFVPVYLIIVLIIYYISYLALNTPEVFKIDKADLDLEVENTQNPFVRPKKISNGNGHNNSADDEKLDNELVELMEKEKMYLDANLSLYTLCERLGVSRHQLSHVINDIHHMNFYEFVNSYRMDHIKSLLEDPESRKLKIISLAYDSGFNSKSSFNRIFKQSTGLTPSEYVKNLP